MSNFGSYLLAALLEIAGCYALWTDRVGVALCLAGTAVILFGPRIAGV